MNFVSFSVFLQPFLAAPAGQTLEFTVLLSETKCSIHLHTQSNVRITNLTFVSLVTKTGNECHKPATGLDEQHLETEATLFGFFFVSLIISCVILIFLCFFLTGYLGVNQALTLRGV